MNVDVPRSMGDQKRAYLQSAIKPAEGVEAFRRVLAAGLPQVAVITRDLQQLITEIANSNKLADSSAVPDIRTTRQASEAGHPRPDLANEFVAPETDIQKKLTEIWIEVLGIAEIGIDDNFFEMGGHSLLATGVLSRVRSVFGVSVPLRTIFETPTIRQFSNHLETLLWIVSGKLKFDHSRYGLERPHGNPELRNAFENENARDNESEWRGPEPVSLECCMRNLPER
jgi:acyl carrier protein